MGAPAICLTMRQVKGAVSRSIIRTAMAKSAAVAKSVVLMLRTLLFSPV